MAQQGALSQKDLATSQSCPFLVLTLWSRQVIPPLWASISTSDSFLQRFLRGRFAIVSVKHLAHGRYSVTVAVLTLFPVGHREPLKVLEEGSNLKKGRPLEKPQRAQVGSHVCLSAPSKQACPNQTHKEKDPQHRVRSQVNPCPSYPLWLYWRFQESAPRKPLLNPPTLITSSTITSQSNDYLSSNSQRHEQIKIIDMCVTALCVREPWHWTLPAPGMPIDWALTGGLTLVTFSQAVLPLPLFSLCHSNHQCSAELMPHQLSSRVSRKHPPPHHDQDIKLCFKPLRYRGCLLLRLIMAYPNWSWIYFSAKCILSTLFLWAITTVKQVARLYSFALVCGISLHNKATLLFFHDDICSGCFLFYYYRPISPLLKFKIQKNLRPKRLFIIYSAARPDPA